MKLLLVHEQIRLPPIVHIPYKMPDEGDMIRFHRRPHQLEPRLFRSAVPFFIVALHTRRDKILPRILSPFRPGMNVVQSQRNITATAILTSMPVPAKDILSGQDDLFIRHSDKGR